MTDNVITPGLFKDIEFPHRSVPGVNASRYRVYSDHRTFVVVEADTILQALQKAAVPNPVRVRRENIYLQNVLDLPRVADDAGRREIIPAVIEPLMVAEKPFAPKQAVTPFEAAEPLSSEQVDQLLKPVESGDAPQDSGSDPQ
jgi:hypothetical protein